MKLGMQVISFKNTALFKRGLWLSAAALIACVAAPSALSGALWRNPVVNVVPLCVLAAFGVYFLRAMRIHRLADQVTDCEDHLKVRRGRIEAIIPFSNISMADVSTHSGVHRITVRLRQPTTLGAQIEFLPQASLWSNPAAVRRLAVSLTERANRAKGGSDRSSL
jgi:hypothetical protein